MRRTGAIQNLLQMVDAVNAILPLEPKVSTKNDGRLASRPVFQDL
jgi:lipid A disaccharide synthetase